jgi:hypothetical protein
MLSKKSSPFLDNVQKNFKYNEVILDIIVTYLMDSVVEKMDNKPIIMSKKCQLSGK